MKGQAPKGKLEAINAANAMCSHKINLTQLGDIDQEVVDWLKMAYEMRVNSMNYFNHTACLETNQLCGTHLARPAIIHLILEVTDNGSKITRTNRIKGIAYFASKLRFMSG